MKTATKTIAIILCIVTLFCLTSCGKSKKMEQFVGTWNCYKIVSDSEALVFKDYELFVKMEYTVNFSSSGQYVMHYYVNGAEGEDYPQSGSFSVKGDKISLSNGGTGEIINGELVLSFENGTLQHFFTK